MSPITCVVIPVTPFEQNCSVVWCTETRRGAIVDPGGEIERILQVVADNGVTIEKILVTHGHADHASGVASLVARLLVPVEGPHEADLFWLNRLAEDGARYGIEGAASFVPDRWLDDGQTVTVGAQTFAVLHCPGHTQGHVVFVHEAARFALVGDVLFRGSVGRTDLPGGDHATLIASIRDKLWPLGDDITFLPGHGPASTLGDERRSNPFVADHLFAND